MTDIITTKDKLKCAERELALRQAFYPKWVKAGKMSEGAKEHELAAMQAIIDDYRAAVEKERFVDADRSLFGV
jgi:hypothetical protein